MTPIADKLVEAAQAVIDRWDSPLWKDLPHTGEFINRLREALAAYASQQAEPSGARVEAAAKAIADVSDSGWHSLEEQHKNDYRSEARAVLQAAEAVSAVPEGFVLVPDKATPLIREALRIGMRREVPNDELCDIRWRAAIAAAQDSETEAGNG